MQKVIVIGGPTASGKTGLGIELAKRIKGEIISADSMQIYKKMDIGTAKPTIEEMQGIKHHLIDFVEPNQRYSVADFKKDAIKKIEEILQNGNVPIVVGGTGLYINSLIYGIDYPEIELDEEYRAFLENCVKEQGLDNLYKKAVEIDPEAMKSISPNDKKRILRVLENGLIDEVESLLKEYKEFPTAMQGLGYKEVVWYLQNKITKEEMIEKIKMETRRYAKRQLTWFRKNKQTIWLDGLKSKQENISIILEEIK